MNKKTNPDKVEELTYEEALDELTSIVEALENEGQTLDETMKLFERGLVLSNRCTHLLEKAELKLKQLNGEKLTVMEEGL